MNSGKAEGGGGVASLYSLALTEEDTTLGDNGAAVEADLSYPRDVEVDDFGYIYISDTGNNRIRKVDPSGIITTVAGSGESNFSLIMTRNS